MYSSLPHLNCSTRNLELSLNKCFTCRQFVTSLQPAQEMGFLALAEAATKLYQALLYPLDTRLWTNCKSASRYSCYWSSSCDIGCGIINLCSLKDQSLYCQSGYLESCGLLISLTSTFNIDYVYVDRHFSMYRHFTLLWIGRGTSCYG